MIGLPGIKKMRKRATAAVFGVLLTIGGPASAALVGYQDRTAFDSAISGWTTQVTNFDGIAAGTQYPAGTGPAGAGFTLTLSGPSTVDSTPTIANTFWSTSGSNYLGLDNPDTAFQAGDSLTISFIAPVHAFGLFIIGTHDIGADDITLASGLTSVKNGAVADLGDGNGSFAFFLGFVADDVNTFSSVTLTDLALGSERLLNIATDDFILAVNDGGTPVPEPASVALMLIGLTAWRMQARRARRSPARQLH